jgi:hypothetical protein
MSLHVSSQMCGCRWFLNNVCPADCTGMDSAVVQCFHRLGPMAVRTLYSNRVVGVRGGRTKAAAVSGHLVTLYMSSVMSVRSLVLQESRNYEYQVPGTSNVAVAPMSHTRSTFQGLVDAGTSYQQHFYSPTTACSRRSTPRYLHFTSSHTLVPGSRTQHFHRRANERISRPVEGFPLYGTTIKAGRVMITPRSDTKCRCSTQILHSKRVHQGANDTLWYYRSQKVPAE